MVVFGLKMLVKRFIEVIVVILCWMRVKEVLVFVDACCRGADFVGEEIASTFLSMGGVLEFGDFVMVVYYMKNVCLLVMEFCEEFN